jgi:C-terminal processing protease CtpA/Prc
MCVRRAFGALLAARLLWLAPFAAGGSGCGRTLQAYPEEFAGVGIVLQASPRGIVVSEVVETGPAALAGVPTGAIVRAVDGRSVEGRTLASVVGSLRGLNLTSVALTVESTEGRRETFSLQRQSIQRADGGYSAR